MKRFFQPVEKEGSSKKPTLSSAQERLQVQVNENDKAKEMVETPTEEPLKFLTWNANSFLLRVKNNWPQFSKFVQALDPDVIAIQVISPLCHQFVQFGSQFDLVCAIHLFGWFF